ncbi:hypothetical protein [Streptomyces sp. NPDC014676]|uniref:hypothetical protein n=1 Tax=Streptomyces sp. NPDC014676 TaxID=3364879 RepID=UPI0036F95F1B
MSLVRWASGYPSGRVPNRRPPSRSAEAAEDGTSFRTGSGEAMDFARGQVRVVHAKTP